MGVHGDEGWSFAMEKNPLWQLKLKLQFTGWLQYLIPAIQATFVMLPLAGLEYFLFHTTTRIFLTLASLLYVITILDIVTIKYDYRPRESIPTKFDDTSTNYEITQQRTSCRSFQTRPLTKDHRREILNVADESMKSTNRIFPNEKVRLEYIEAPLTVWPAVNARQFFVAIAPSQPYSKTAILDLGRSLQRVVFHATRMGLGTLWIGPGADHDSIIQALGNNDNYDPNKDHIICVCAIGYKSAFVPLGIRLLTSTMHRSRLPLKQLFFRDNECQQSLEILKKNEEEDLYLLMKACQSSPSSYNAQTTRSSVSTQLTYNGDAATQNKLTMIRQFDFYRSLNSKYYATIAVGIWLANFEYVCQQLGSKYNGRFVIIQQDVVVNSSKEHPNETIVENDDENEKKPPLYDISYVFDTPIELKTETNKDTSYSGGTHVETPLLPPT